MAATVRPASATHEVTNQAPARRAGPPQPVHRPRRRLSRDSSARAPAGPASASRPPAPCGAASRSSGRALANENPPVLRTHDRFGHRIDEVEFHPAYHRLMELSSAHGGHSLPWNEPRDGAHVARAAGALCAGQVEAGHGCPITMTFAAIPALRAAPDILAEWGPLLTADAYDGELRPAAEKGSAKCGMAMTEKQGGSDVRANTTRAEPVGGDEYLITGHKWFCSAPMCDLFLVLAQTAEGVVVLRRAADPARRRAQRLPAPAPQGQARQQVQRQLGGRVRRHLGPPRRRARPRCPDDHRDGRPHPPRLRHRQHGGDARRRGGGDVARRAPRGVRQAARRPAADAQRARRPRHRVRGGHGAGAAPRARLRRAGHRVQAPGHRGRQVLGLQAPARRTPPRRWRCWAATATSRSPACRGCSASRR